MLSYFYLAYQAYSFFNQIIVKYSLPEQHQSIQEFLTPSFIKLKSLNYTNLVI